MLVRTLPLLLLTVTAAHAGTKLETVSRDLAGGAPQTINTWAQDGMLRIDALSQNSTAIFKDDTIYLVKHQEKTFTSLDRASMKRMSEQLGPALQMLQERMKTMTPEQRAQMEKMLGTRLPDDAAEVQKEFKRTSRSDKISGYSCTYVEVREAGELTDEVCVVPASAMKGAADLMVSAKKMSELMHEMMGGMPWLKQMAQKQLQDFEALGGIPVLSRHFLYGKPQNETLLKSIGAETVAASQFEIPAGYTKKDMMAPG